MTLDDIQESIFQGDRGIKKAIDIVDTYLTKNPNKKDVVNSTLWNVKRKAQQLAPSFVNQIKVTTKYREPLKFAIGTFDGGELSPAAVATFVMDKVTQDANKRILTAKEPKTKRNREYEKTIVTKFLHGNYNQLVLLVELYKLFLLIKMEINHAPN
jgi:hypothetical protein